VSSAFSDTSKVFTAKISSYVDGDKKRVRLEIQRPLVDSFLEQIGSSGQVSIFVIPPGQESLEGIYDMDDEKETLESIEKN